MVSVESLATVSYSHFVVMVLSRIVSEIKRDSDQKSRFFHTHVFDASVMGFPLKYCRTVRYGTRSPASAEIANRPLVFLGTQLEQHSAAIT